MNNKNNEMCVLAKMVQNLIKLNSESVFVPIENNNYYNYNNFGINEEIFLENNIEKEEIKNEIILNFFLHILNFFKFFYFIYTYIY